MLTTIEQNQSRFSSAELFELAPVYLPKKGDLPSQTLRLILAVYGRDGREAFLKAKGALERFTLETGLGDFFLTRDADKSFWHAVRSARIHFGKETLGVIGQVNDGTARAFGLDTQAVLVDLDFERLVPFLTSSKSFTPISLFPSVKRDLAFVVSERVEYAAVVERIKKSSELLEDVELFDVYRGKGMENGQKSIAIHLSFRSDERTLESREVDIELESIRSVLQKEFGAIMRS